MKAEIKERIEKVRRGDVPEGYRKTKDIGIAPSDWVLGQMSDVLHNEQRPVPKPSEAYWRLGLRSHAKGTFHELVENPNEINMDELYEVKANDLIVNITFAWEHAIALADDADEGLLVSHRFPTYIFYNGISPQFFKAVVTQRFFKDMLRNISPGGAGRNRVMSKPAFLKLPCYIPLIDEQQKVAEILAHCDKVIELKKRLIDEKRSRKKWLMQNLLIPDSGLRLPGFEGEWKKIKLSKLGNTYSGLSGKTADDFGEGQPYISYLNIFVNPVVDSSKYEFVSITADENQNSVRYGDIFFTTSSETPKEVGMSSVYLGNNEELYLNSFCFGYRLYNFDKLIPEFAAFYFRSQVIKRLMYKLAQGATRYNLSKTELMKETITIPPTREEQVSIANVFFATDCEIKLLEQELYEWQAKKKSLMQLLLTGLVRVNV